MVLRKNLFYSLLAILAVILVGAMIIHPESTFQGALTGLKTWGLILVPSLLPFFIISDLLVELGVVRLLGVLLEPLMRPLFKQPGESGFVVAMGFTSGFPMGAVLTNTLYEKKILTTEEAGRLLAFTNNSSPLFLLVAIPVGMFNNPQIGIILLLAHYGANLLLGVLLGFLAKNKNRSITNFQHINQNLRNIIDSQRKTMLPLGALLGKAVNKSIQNILTVGGFVIFFAVLIEILQETNFFYSITLFIGEIIHFLGLDPNLSDSLTIGFFEMTLGAQKAAQTNTVLNQQLMIVSLILGWSGLSIQAQVASIAARTAIPVFYYHGGRIFQSIVAFFLTFILFEPLNSIFPVGNFEIIQPKTFSLLDYYSFTMLAGIIFLTVLLILSFLLKIIVQIKKYRKRSFIK